LAQATLSDWFSLFPSAAQFSVTFIQTFDAI
jgi:hypothetical protein